MPNRSTILYCLPLSQKDIAECLVEHLAKYMPITCNNSITFTLENTLTHINLCGQVTNQDETTSRPDKKFSDDVLVYCCGFVAGFISGKAVRFPSKSEMLQGIQHYDNELFAWMLNIRKSGRDKTGLFLSAIILAALSTSPENQRLLYTLLKKLQIEYPEYNP